MIIYFYLAQIFGKFTRLRSLNIIPHFGSFIIKINQIIKFYLFAKHTNKI